MRNWANRFDVCLLSLETSKMLKHKLIIIHARTYIYLRAGASATAVRQVIVHQFHFVKAAQTSRLLGTLCTRLFVLKFFGNLPRNSTVVAHSEISTTSSRFS